MDSLSDEEFESFDIDETDDNTILSSLPADVRDCIINDYEKLASVVK